MVLTLQAEVDMVEKGIQTAKTTIVKSECSQESLLLIQGLERTHERLREKIEKLYASLNVHDAFPELRGINLEFVRTLLMARDLKMNIRKRAISSFFEWEKLDRAVGGHHEPLGQYSRPLCFRNLSNPLYRNQTSSANPQSHLSA
jgi:hypothetical protein